MTTREFWAAEAAKMRDTSVALDAVEHTPKTASNAERSGAIIREDGTFMQIDGTRDYYFKERKSENFICSKENWAANKTIPKQYIKALSTKIKSFGIAGFSDSNILFDARTDEVAIVQGTLTTVKENAVDENGIPSYLITFEPESEWNLTVYKSPDCLNYFSLGSILAHENRHIQQIKILKNTFFANVENSTELQKTRLLITEFAGMKVAMESDAYRFQKEFMAKNKFFNVELGLNEREKKSYDAEVERLRKALKMQSLEGIPKKQFEDAKKKWEEIFKKN